MSKSSFNFALKSYHVIAQYASVFCIERLSLGYEHCRSTSNSARLANIVRAPRSVKDMKHTQIISIYV